MNISKLKTLAIVFVLAMTTACSGDDDSATATLELYNVLVGGVNPSESLNDVPVNTDVEISFSRSLSEAAVAAAISVTGGGNEVPFDLTLSNVSSKATVTLSGLEPQTEYQFLLSGGVLGQNGESYSGDISFSFRTGNGDLYTPCTSGTTDCLRTFTVEAGGNSFNLDYYANYDTESDPTFVWDEIQNLIVVVHGQNRDADFYFSTLNNALSGTTLQQNTLVISPQFKNDAEAEGSDLFWGSDWRFGANASNTGAAVSSFEVTDQLIALFSDATRFPNLRNIYVSGHSSGAAFAHYYGLANQTEASLSGLTFRYSVLNTQYYYHPGAERYNETTMAFEVPAGCAGYTSWPYGFEFAPDYVQTTGKTAIDTQLAAGNFTYFLGENDTSTTGELNTTDCQATLLGSNRFTRGQNYQRYLNQYVTGNISTFTTVPGIGHDTEGMYLSGAFREYLEATQ